VHRERDDLPAVAVVGIGSSVHERDLLGDLLAHGDRAPQGLHGDCIRISSGWTTQGS
jgi:hypothetical protein